MPAELSGLVLSGLRTLETEAGGITALVAAMQDGMGVAFTAAVEAIRAARGRVVVTGMGKSGHIGRKIAATLASTGTPALFVHPAEASHGDLGMITADDVIMALSWSGETIELKNLIDYSKRHRIALLAITADVRSTLVNGVDFGMTMVAGMPSRWQWKATPCAWLPAEAVITPRARASAGMCAILLYAPRSLNEKTGWLSSRFR